MLTSLSNPDGDRVNHELGICLPQFVLDLAANCTLTITPKYVGNAFISLLNVGAAAGEAPPLPLANAAPSEITDAVQNTMGYYYLAPTRCPVAYKGQIKGAALISSGERTFDEHRPQGGSSQRRQCCSRCQAGVRRLCPPPPSH